MSDDPIEQLAERLHATYYLDTKHEGTPWPPSRDSHRRAWRRVAAHVIDLMGAR